VATVTNDADEIRRRMAEIRCELHKDVREVVASAEAVTDWHRYLRMYPWTILGAAVAVGYFLVPKRHKVVVPVPVVVDASKQVDTAQVREAVEETGKRRSRKGLIGAAFGLVAPLAVRAAQSYAMQYLETWIAQQQAMATGPPPVAPTQAPRASGGPSRRDSF